jgi:pyruvate kinase
MSNRHTKIIATLGPSSRSDATIDLLIAAGADIFRLNFSHGTWEEHGALIGSVRAAAARADRQVAILQDLSGPKIRTGPLADGRELQLTEGDRLAIITGEGVGGEGRVFTTYAGLAPAVRPGDRLLLADGRIEVRVESSDGHTIETRVVNGGALGQHKGINSPGVVLPASALTEKDVADLRFGVSHGVDMVALSFVQTAGDVERARRALAEAGDVSVPLVAKIERPRAVENIDAILAFSDAVMVARGDLGLEMPLEQVPRVQKDVVRRARARGIPVILATQVLESMHTEPRPTRAEVSDAANAVDESVDAIMLSGETAAGRYPVEAVRMLDAIVRDAERLPAERLAVGPDVIPIAHSRAICEAAVTLASSGQASAIVAVTRAGKTARVLSAFRPPVPIFAATASDEVARRLTIHRGVVPFAVGDALDADPTGGAIERHLLEHRMLEPSCVIVFVSVHADLTRDNANFLRIRRIGEPR